MVRRYGWPLWLLIAVVGTALAVAPSAAAQTSGTVRGIVTDANGQPVEGATVTITGEATGRKYQSRTNRRGEFIQIGLTVGPYVLVAEKDKQASEPAKAAVRNSAPASVSLILGAAPSAAASKESTTFGEGVALSTAGKHAEAIEKFNAGIVANPACFECYNNIGYSYTQMKEYDKAEAAYKKAAELKPDNATAWNGLANIYNAQRKFDLAAEASKKATDLSGGGGVGLAAVAETPMRCTTRASSCGTAARSPTRRSSSRRPFRPIPAMPRRTISWGWRSSTKAISPAQAASSKPT